MIKNTGKLLVVMAMFSGVAMAETTPPESGAVKGDIVKLVDIAGKQRMLSQNIAKNYLYVGKKIATAKARKQLKNSLSELLSSHKKLTASINDPDINNLLAFVEMSSEDFKATAHEPFSLENAQLVMDLSESMLEGSQYVVDSLKDSVKMNESVIVGLAGKQRMLSQRIAKYYIAYQAGIKDKNTVDQMNLAVSSFVAAHNALLINKTNTPAINRKLNDIDRLWKIVYKFYLNIEKGGLPLIVYNTTDNITKKMNEVTKLYVDLAK